MSTFLVILLLAVLAYSAMLIANSLRYAMGRPLINERCARLRKLRTKS